MGRILLLKRKLILILIAAALFFLFLIIHNTLNWGKIHWSNQNLTVIRIESSAYPCYDYFVETGDLFNVLKRDFVFDRSDSRCDPHPQGWHRIEFVFNGQNSRTIYYHMLGDFFYDNESYLLNLPEKYIKNLKRLLADYYQQAYLDHGSLVHWRQVDRIFPLMSQARITDYRTGLSFMVQRRAGSRHADVQPITARDTRIMHEIYGGRWSWDRRGIIVETGGWRIAASMNGMPHGGGKIDDNKFPGHFCIHFMGSTTHSGNMDQRHMDEILKAAGKIPVEDQG